MSAGDLVAERARITPQRIAVISAATGERLTYGELNHRVDRAAAALRSRGIGEGDRFGLLTHNCIEFLDLFFAAPRVGAIVAPLSTRATAHELVQIGADCDPKVVFCGDEHASVGADAFGERAVPLKPAGVESAVPASAPASDPESIHCLVYTSGTTGKPKGVMISRRQLFWNGINTAINWGLREDDVTPVFTPLYHAGGFGAFLIPVFCAGGTVVIHRDFEPAAIWATIERERCTVVLGVPTIWKILMESPGFATARLDHVRWFISGGAPLPGFLIDAYEKRGVVLKQGYGLIEVGVNCFTMTAEDALVKRGSIGRPLMFTEARLVGEDGSDDGEGIVGELWIRGPHVSSGYWNNPEATAEAYREGGWFRTGDLARRDAEGFYYIAGRRKEMFISGGVNVYPAEIEAELIAHPSVSDAAVLAVPDETWGEVAVAFVVAPELDEPGLRAYLGGRIAKFKVPRRFLFLETLPRTPYGKVVKEQLRSLLVSRTGETGERSGRGHSGETG